MRRLGAGRLRVRSALRRARVLSGWLAVTCMTHGARAETSPAAAALSPPLPWPSPPITSPSVPVPPPGPPVPAPASVLAPTRVSEGAGAAPNGNGADAPRAAFGRLEEESLEDALHDLGLVREPRPEGKIIGMIHAVNQEVFSRRDWWFQWFNHFHRTTRPDVLRRELLVKPGEVYDASLVEESLRNLQSPAAIDVAGSAFLPPELSSVVAIVPVVSPQPGHVDLLAVTRDVWSLRFNTDFEFQQNTLSYLSTSLSENNLFGWRKFLSAGFLLDQGRTGFGPTYFDPNIAGTRLTLYLAAVAWYARDTGNYEGDSETFSLHYPLYALGRPWGAGIDVIHQNAVNRTFRGNALTLDDVLLPTGQTEAIPAIYRRRVTTVDGNFVRSYGLSVLQRLTFGYRVDVRSSEALAGFPDPAALQPFLDQWAPVSERRSEPYVRYDVFTARFAAFRDLDTFDLRENRRLGPSLSLRLAYGLPALGADFRALVMGASAAWVVALGPGTGGYGSAQVSASARLRQGGDLIDQNLSAGVYAATPFVARVFRLVLSAGADLVRHDTFRTLYLVGGSTGLRGYAIGEFQGTHDAEAHAELRTAPLALLSQRVGALLFYDVGDAAATFADLVAYQDFGLGIRWLIPQFNSSVVRIDWAFAARATPYTTVGLPGRFTAGFQQVF